MSPRVIIVGAGPVGLLLACELGVRQIPVVVVEELSQLTRHPKANTQSARSMEIYRRHGLSGRIRSMGLPAARATDVAYFTRLFGRELFRVPLPSPDDALMGVLHGDPRWPTPEPQYRISQKVVELVLLERARSFAHVDVRFGWAGVQLAQDANRVTLIAEDVDS